MGFEPAYPENEGQNIYQIDDINNILINEGVAFIS